MGALLRASINRPVTGRCSVVRNLTSTTPPPSQPCPDGAASSLCVTLLIVEADAAVSVDPTPSQPSGN